VVLLTTAAFLKASKTVALIITHRKIYRSFFYHQHPYPLESLFLIFNPSVYSTHRIYFLYVYSLLVYHWKFTKKSDYLSKMHY